MGQDRRQPQAEEGPSAPLWMVTFSDCMNLLLTFFVLLVTFSSFDTDVLTDLGAVFRRIFPSLIDVQKEMPKDASLPTTLIMPVEAHEKGSEKPTLTRGPDDNLLKEETQPSEFHNRKVFQVSSKSIFLGRGTAISPAGKNILVTMASFLKEVPSRIVISETGPDNQGDEQIGLRRAWAVVEYLTAKQGLDKKWFSISAASFLPKEGIENGQADNTKSDSEHTLEIVLLERSIYN